MIHGLAPITTVDMLRDEREKLRDLSLGISREADILAWGKVIRAVVKLTEAMDILAKENQS